MTRAELEALARRVESAKRGDNWLDVECEIALFRPNSVYSAIRANNAGIKVIYTDRAGNEVACWPEYWTLSKRRLSTAAAIRARAKEKNND